MPHKCHHKHKHCKVRFNYPSIATGGDKKEPSKSQTDLSVEFITEFGTHSNYQNETSTYITAIVPVTCDIKAITNKIHVSNSGSTPKTFQHLIALIHVDKNGNPQVIDKSGNLHPMAYLSTSAGAKNCALGLNHTAVAPGTLALSENTVLMGSNAPNGGTGIIITGTGATTNGTNYVWPNVPPGNQVASVVTSDGSSNDIKVSQSNSF
jgi:hypothetical protein